MEIVSYFSVIEIKGIVNINVIKLNCWLKVSEQIVIDFEKTKIAIKLQFENLMGKAILMGY